MYKLVFSVFLLAISSAAQSGSVQCAGKVSMISISEAGNVHATISNGATVSLRDVLFCDLNSTSGTFSGQACSGLLSLLMTGEAMGKTARLWFRDGEFTSCEQNWVNVKSIGFYHIRLE